MIIASSEYGNKNIRNRKLIIFPSANLSCNWQFAQRFLNPFYFFSRGNSLDKRWISYVKDTSERPG